MTTAAMEAQRGCWFLGVLAPGAVLPLTRIRGVPGVEELFGFGEDVLVPTLSSCCPVLQRVPAPPYSSTEPGRRQRGLLSLVGVWSVPS